jgi:hypothetical protein
MWLLTANEPVLGCLNGTDIGVDIGDDRLEELN